MNAHTLSICKWYNLGVLMVESESVHTTLHSLEHGPCPLWSGAITKPLVFGTELACDHECYVFGLLLHHLYADYNWDCIASLSWSLHKVLTLILVLLHCDPCYHCTIWSSSSSSVWYNLLQVWLSLADSYQPLLSSTYTSIYGEEYINCTTRTLGP